MIIGALLAEKDLAYAAGLFDGEGCIQLRKAGGANKPATCPEAGLCLYISVANTNTEVLTWLKEHFGGNVYDMHPKGQPEGWSRGFAWVTSGKNAAAFLHKVYPYLKIKRGQAEPALLFAETYHKGWRAKHNSISSEARTLRRIAYRAFRQRINAQGGRGKV